MPQAKIDWIAPSRIAGSNVLPNGFIIRKDPSSQWMVHEWLQSPCDRGCIFCTSPMNHFCASQGNNIKETVHFHEFHGIFDDFWFAPAVVPCKPRVLGWDCHPRWVPWGQWLRFGPEPRWTSVLGDLDGAGGSVGKTVQLWNGSTMKLTFGLAMRISMEQNRYKSYFEKKHIPFLTRDCFGNGHNWKLVSFIFFGVLVEQVAVLPQIAKLLGLLLQI